MPGRVLVLLFTGFLTYAICIVSDDQSKIENSRSETQENRNPVAQSTEEDENMPDDVEVQGV